MKDYPEKVYVAGITGRAGGFVNILGTFTKLEYAENRAIEFLLLELDGYHVVFVQEMELDIPFPMDRDTDYYHGKPAIHEKFVASYQITESLDRVNGVPTSRTVRKAEYLEGIEQPAVPIYTTP